MTHTLSLSWTPVALSSDVPPGTVIPAKLSSGPIAVWRTQSGHLSANGDRCPHRGMRLSHGFVRGETLSCIYHGWRFADDGSCTHIPAHPDLTPPSAIKCNPRQAKESGGVIWVADELPDKEPVFFEGFKPLRSLVVAADEASVREAAQATNVEGGLAASVAGTDIRLLVSDLDGEQVFVILLLAENTSPEACVSASRWAEVMRQKAERIRNHGETS
ncbi:Rieske (2Fe-2S) protein [Shimia thalassica]|uniref:Rieske (2Fe-2S) protein n=1 Tax=Shimia thalassica TaxID=1715693 RepID=UPI0026E1828D|nr:Rieske (2Fe-2S) protein [Shimia thalassica]MDO6523795.1 Rieske (2Fe-2S) protein [Shimia thalassica]